ncbi:type IV pilus modification PilV family protein [Fimbriimonas ginsengisoli]|uniref:General secretion pathway protein I n=1 Tax=Fimbriimonas ginsengisoli Gsoil 348 TaxID=661478 RepID=A0A068NVQ0_FIMGI|nr:prepilin-type N-terminal cleavage/methylation domain-containing protein [Fimbriimonas ginsengisoli]AIE87568.1 general secretion pathway protein I [Fimbriimonas ginsengisoli Gsoil 348]
MSTGRRPTKGFTLIEALVAVALLTGGIVAVLGALASMTRTESRFRDQDQMQRLAMQKLDELVSTSDNITAPQNGDFKDRDDDRFVWSSEEAPSGVENLDAITVTVRYAGNPAKNAPESVVSTLLYVPPTNTTGATQ